MKKMNKCVPLKVSMYPKGKKKKEKEMGRGQYQMQ